jgi:hypothetical protein
MAVDFRTLLKEHMRNQEAGERWFEDLDIGGVFYLSIQASTLHASTPPELLDDAFAYEAFQVVLQAKPGVYICGKNGAWDRLAAFDWFPLFVEDSPILREAENVPVSVLQRIFEDVSACANAHPEMLKNKHAKGIKLL